MEPFRFEKTQIIFIFYFYFQNILSILKYSIDKELGTYKFLCHHRLTVKRKTG